MSVSRLVKDIKSSDKETIASTASSQIGGFSLTFVAQAAIQHHAPAILESMNNAADSFIPCKAFAGRLAVQTFNALHAVKSGSTFALKATLKTVAENLAYDLIGAEIATAAYNGINMLAGRDVSDIHPAEQAAVASMGATMGANAAKGGVAVLADAFRFARDKAPACNFSFLGKSGNPDAYAKLAAHADNSAAPAPTSPMNKV
jgi:hypothetical protein